MGGGQLCGLLYLELAGLDREGAEVRVALPGLTTNEACVWDLLATTRAWSSRTSWPRVCRREAAVGVRRCPSHWLLPLVLVRIRLFLPQDRAVGRTLRHVHAMSPFG